MTNKQKRDLIIASLSLAVGIGLGIFLVDLFM